MQSELLKLIENFDVISGAGGAGDRETGGGEKVKRVGRQRMVGLLKRRAEDVAPYRR